MGTSKNKTNYTGTCTHTHVHTHSSKQKIGLAVSYRKYLKGRGGKGAELESSRGTPLDGDGDDVKADMLWLERRQLCSDLVVWGEHSIKRMFPGVAKS